MSQGKYRTVDVKQVNWAKVAEQSEGARVVFGVDVAKEVPVGALMTPDLGVLVTIRWRDTQETRWVMDRLQEHWGSESLEVVMEPSGSYGDPLRHLCEARGIKVYRVQPKRVHDATEVYDGVPSLHDAKAAYLIGRLHLDGGSRRWEKREEWFRDLKAVVQVLEFHDEQRRRALDKLEGWLARHWPEAGEILSVKTVTQMRLLSSYGSPQAVASHADEARELMRRTGGVLLGEEKIERLLNSARSTLGVRCCEGERRYGQVLAQAALDHHREWKKARKAVVERVEANATMRALAPVVGPVTSAVVVASQGQPQAYSSAAAFVKAMGLNLKEHSSGKHRGQLKLTKRGPGMVRKYLYFAALRQILRDPIVQSWYHRKVQRDGGRKGKAIVAIMRKLAKSLWHVARGHAFDTRLLFNLRALGGDRAPNGDADLAPVH